MNKVYVTLDGTEFSTKESALEYQELSNNADTEFAEKRRDFLNLKELANIAENAVLKFQEECSHEYVTLRARSDTGNYDPSDNSYWYDIECKCCEHRWTEDQSTSSYRRRNDSKVEIIR